MAEVAVAGLLLVAVEVADRLVVVVDSLAEGAAEAEGEAGRIGSLEKRD